MRKIRRVGCLATLRVRHHQVLQNFEADRAALPLRVYQEAASETHQRGEIESTEFGEELGMLGEELCERRVRDAAVWCVGVIEVFRR
ncbi:MAG: hypothetical protein WDO56_32660 [Gammaproteobacteria bacterium]